MITLDAGSIIGIRVPLYCPLDEAALALVARNGYCTLLTNDGALDGGCIAVSATLGTTVVPKPC